MAAGALDGIRTVFPRLARRPATVEPLIKEARDRQRRRRRWTAALVVVAVGAGLSVSHWASSGQAGLACTSGASCTQAAASARTVPNPCTLLTNAQATTIVGNKFSYRYLRHDQGIASCTWAFAPLGSFTGEHASLMVAINTGTKAQIERSQRKYHYTVAHGVGKFAYWVGLTGPVQLLTVWDHGYTLTVVATAVPSAVKTEKTAAIQMLKQL